MALEDGLTFLVETIYTQALNPTVYSNLAFQPSAFLPVASIASVPIVFAGPQMARY